MSGQVSVHLGCSRHGQDGDGARSDSNASQEIQGRIAAQVQSRGTQRSPFADTQARVLGDCGGAHGRAPVAAGCERCLGSAIQGGQGQRRARHCAGNRRDGPARDPHATVAVQPVRLAHSPCRETGDSRHRQHPRPTRASASEDSIAPWKQPSFVPAILCGPADADCQGSSSQHGWTGSHQLSLRGYRGPAGEQEGCRGIRRRETSARAV